MWPLPLPDPRQSDATPSPRLAVLLTGLLVLGPLLPTGGAAGSDESELPLFVSPSPLSRIVGDPWMGGAWIGTAGVGLFFKPLDRPGLYHYGLVDGLPHARVHHIAPTPEEVFVATDRGIGVLSKGDHTFDQVTHDNGTRFKWTSRMLLVEDDVVWAGTDDHGLFRIDRATLEASAVPNPHNGSRFEHPVLGADVRGPELFVTAAGYGLVQWDRETGETHRYNLSLLDGRALYGRVEVAHGEAWVGTSGDGAIRFDLATREGREYMGVDQHEARHAQGVAIVGNEVWFANEAGTSKYDRRTDAWTNYQYPEWHWGGAWDLNLINGTLYAVTDHDHVVRYDRQADAWEEVRWWTKDRVLSWNTVKGCGVQGDRLLFATAGGASLWYDVAQGRYVKAGQEPDSQGTPPYGAHHRTVEVRPGETWLGTTFGLLRFDHETSTWEPHLNGDPTADRLHQQIEDVWVSDTDLWAITSAFYNGYGNFWEAGMLMHLDRTTGAWTNYTVEDGLSSGDGQAVLVHDGQVWAATKSGGLDVLDPTTGTLERVYPADENTLDTVWDLAIHDGTLYGASRSGLLVVDPATRETQVLTPPGYPATASLFVRGDQLWLGTAGNGLVRFDTTNQTFERFGLGHPNGADHWIYCIAEYGGLLFLGTQLGVARFDLATQQYLSKAPSLVRPHEGGATVEAAAISITAPKTGSLLPVGGTVTVAGNATGPDDAEVRVRVGGLAWKSAQGMAPWTVEVPLEEAGTGNTEVVARVVREGQVLAQVAIPVRIGTPDEGPAPEVRHVPLLTLDQFDAPWVRVVVDPAPDQLQGTLHVRPPGADAFEGHPLDRNSSGVLETRFPVQNETGTAAYFLTVDWSDGQARLPEPASPYGQIYQVQVRPQQGIGAASLVDVPATLTVEPGQPIELSITLQNVGNREATFQVAFSGPAAGWMDPVESMTLAAATSGALDLTGTAGDPVPDNAYLNLTIAPTDPLRATGATTTITLEGASSTPAPGDQDGTGTGQETPAPGAIAVAALLSTIALAGAASRRRRRPPRPKR